MNFYRCRTPCSGDKTVSPINGEKTGKHQVSLINKFSQKEHIDRRKAWILKLRIGKSVTKDSKMMILKKTAVRSNSLIHKWPAFRTCSPSYAHFEITVPSKYSIYFKIFNLMSVILLKNVINKNIKQFCKKTHVYIEAFIQFFQNKPIQPKNVSSIGIFYESKNQKKTTTMPTTCKQ
ncbi:hypothetical protein NQ318_008239 [Aromia moschata]|uniref:THAP-type domain-containing protein n=1 Tax=Aromia moschata TaxID=1265417 RepID=A0AAV8Y7K9_9CUCU|nr:hypothetical protein NQ318_008239 [Aromia moschata]